MSYTCLLSHIIFATKERRPLLADKDSRHRLHAYIGGIVRNLNGRAYAIGGVDDHVHLLVALPPTAAIADVLRTMKTNSSSWAKDLIRDFAWQAKYAAFSVSHSNRSAVARYIERQEEHHKQRTFEQEFIELLDRHGVAYDRRYLWTE